MTIDKGIIIRNIYYMLSYAFQVLRQENYEQVAAEDFEHVHDMFAAILAKGIAKQLKQGLHREYVTMCEPMPGLKGKLELAGTLKHRMQRKPLLSCEHDELTVDNVFNRILKTTAVLLMKSDTVSDIRKRELSRVMMYFGEIGSVRPDTINWERLVYNRNNRTYQMLMNICYFVFSCLLQTTGTGEYRMAAFSDEQMAKVYEKFILEYYRQHWPDVNARPAQVEWDLDGDDGNSMMCYLPRMQTDVLLSRNGRKLIIDAKYYGRSMQVSHDTPKLHSANLYQIFTYVKNEDVNKDGTVSGLLLYAKTENSLSPDCEYCISGNRIGVKTLDLNRKFEEIAAQLDAIIVQWVEGVL